MISTRSLWYACASCVKLLLAIQAAPFSNRADADMHMRVQVQAWPHTWSSDEDMCERMQSVKSTSIKDNENERLENQGDEGTEGERHTHKKKGSHVRRRRSCLPCRHTPPDKHDHFSSATTFMPRLLAACIRPGERERERECWGGKRNQTRPTVLNCLTMLVPDTCSGVARTSLGSTGLRRQYLTTVPLNFLYRFSQPLYLCVCVLFLFS